MINYQKAVKELRDKLIMTQQEFAQLLGVSFASINRWETGANKPTTIIKRKIVELCKTKGEIYEYVFNKCCNAVGFWRV